MLEIGPVSPTKKEYELKCKVLVKEKTYLDEQSKGTTQVTEKMVYLIPTEGSERDRFLSAWLPEDEDEKFEIGLMIKHPVHGPARGCIKRKNKDVDAHHIFIMSRGVEEELKSFTEEGFKIMNAIKGKTVIVTVLSEDDEVVIDGSKDYSLSVNKNK